MIPADLAVETGKALLRPLNVTDYPAMLQLAQQDEDMWYYFSLNLADPVQLQRWFETAFAEKAANTRRPFTIIDKQTGQIAGSSSLGNISMYDLRAEIGWSWLAPAFRSTGLNKHAKFAMMRYAFEEQHFERIEFKTDEQNARARKGLQNVGGIEEGILRSHMKMWNNRRRTSIYYSVLKNEWPELKATIFKDF
jgi:RimJ/RimL family protein N-acetyltransferase